MGRFRGIRFIRVILTLLLMPLPRMFKNPLCKFFLNWRIGEGAKIGLSYIDAEDVVIGAFTRVGHFNHIRNCSSFVLGQRVVLMNGNKFFGSSFSGNGWSNSIQIDNCAYITSGHFFDIGGGILIEKDVVIGGRESQLWSHSIRIVEGRKELIPCQAKVSSGAYLGSRVILVCSSIPSNSLVGAGAVISKSFNESPFGSAQLIAGNPASVRREYSFLRSKE